MLLHDQSIHAQVKSSNCLFACLQDHSCLIIVLCKHKADVVSEKDINMLPCNAGADVSSAVSAAASAATEGAEKTKGMKAAAGRSSYIPDEALKDTADPGASAVGLWLQAVADTLHWASGPLSS